MNRMPRVTGAHVVRSLRKVGPNDSIAGLSERRDRGSFFLPAQHERTITPVGTEPRAWTIGVAVTTLEGRQQK